MTDVGTMTQTAPFPAALDAVVSAMRYRPGWKFRLEHIDRGQGSEGLTFVAISTNPDTYDPERTLRVAHYFIVPAASYNQASWERWVLDRLIDIETHEAAEFFVITDDGADRRPFAPVHAPGHDPYYVREVARVEDVETNFRGERDTGSQ